MNSQANRTDDLRSPLKIHSERRDIEGPVLEKRYNELVRIVGGYESAAVAFSAGSDSTLVLKLCLDVLGRDRVLAVTGRSPSVPQAELDEAAALAGDIGAEHIIIDTNEFADPNYRSNPTNRCYYCKTTLYAHMGRLLAERGLTTVVNGTNADDLHDYRPGLAAAGEHRVRSPLAEAGLTKQDVRALSKRLGLHTHDKPASPCLSSRVPYGEEVTPEKLQRIEAAEAFLKSIGIRECRVRHHTQMARIEVAPSDFPRLLDQIVAAKIDAHFRALGFNYVTLDLRGFRSGGLNEVIAFGRLQG